MLRTAPVSAILLVAAFSIAHGQAVQKQFAISPFGGLTIPQHSESSTDPGTSAHLWLGAQLEYSLSKKVAVAVGGDYSPSGDAHETRFYGGLLLRPFGRFATGAPR